MPHAALRVGPPLAAGPVSVLHYALDLVQRGGVGDVRPRPFARDCRYPAQRLHPALEVQADAIAVAQRAEAGFVECLGRRMVRGPNLDLMQCEPVDERSQSQDAAQLTLSVESADLHRPESRMRANVPPDPCVVAQLSRLSDGADHRHVILVVVEASRNARAWQ